MLRSNLFVTCVSKSQAVTAAALAFAFAVAPLACSTSAASRPLAAGLVENFPVSTPSKVSAIFERSYVADVKAVQYAEVRARSSGIIQAVQFDEGQAVKAGQALFMLNSLDLQQALRRAQAETKTAIAELQIAHLEEQGTQLLFDKHVVSEAELSVARSKVHSLKAKIEECKANEGQASIKLTYAQISAPFSGVVNRVHHRVGSLVDEDNLLTTIANTDEVFIYFRMSERDYLEYQASKANTPNRKVAFLLADGSAYPHEGVIDAVESEFDPQTGNLAFRARFNNPDHMLKHGNTGKIVLSQQLDDVLVVPQKATFDIQGNVYVYVLDENNRPRAQRIVPGLRLKDTFVIESGIGVEDRFVMDGLQRVKEGVAVGVLPAG